MAVDTYALTTLVNLKLALAISANTDDTLLENCIDSATTIIENHLDFKVMARDYSEWIDARGSNRFRLANQPVNSVRSISGGMRDAMIVTAASTTLIGATVACDGTQVRIITTASDGTDTTTNIALATYKSVSAVVAQADALSAVSASTVTNGRSAQLHIQPGMSFLDKSVVLTMAWDSLYGYRVDEVTGTVWIVPPSCEGLPSGGQRYLVEYNAGEATIPYDIEAACIAVASALYHAGKKDPTLQSESLGQYSYTNKIIGENATLQGQLDDLVGARKRIR
jgi:hypothetical protein